MYSLSPDTCVGVEERREFLKTLASVRKDVPILLEMLAETRARFRGIGGPDHTMDTKARAYRSADTHGYSRFRALLSKKILPQSYSVDIFYFSLLLLLLLFNALGDV